MDARTMFRDQVVEDLRGKPAPRANRGSGDPLKDAFIDMATADLTNGENLSEKSAAEQAHPQRVEQTPEDVNALKDSFARSIVLPGEVSEKRTVIIEDFKKQADTEAQDTLRKLLKGTI